MQPEFGAEFEMTLQHLGDYGEQIEKSGVHFTQGHFRSYTNSIFIFICLI